MSLCFISLTALWVNFIQQEKHKFECKTECEFFLLNITELITNFLEPDKLAFSWIKKNKCSLQIYICLNMIISHFLTVWGITSTYF